MLLYHFTSAENLPHIRGAGLSRGTVLTSAGRALNAVWLTTDPGPGGHGLEAGGAIMTDNQRRQAEEWSGILPPPGTRFPKPATARITVNLDPADRRLQVWLSWARGHLAPEWFAQLHPVASGNLRQAKTWRLYFGIIPPQDFVAIEPVKLPPDVAARPAAPASLRAPGPAGARL